MRPILIPALFAAALSLGACSSSPCAMCSAKSVSNSACEGARMPMENVRHASAATPWCGTPGGR